MNNNDTYIQLDSTQLKRTLNLEVNIFLFFLFNNLSYHKSIKYFYFFRL